MERKNYTDALIESLEEAVRDDKGNIQMQFDDYGDDGELKPEIKAKFNKLTAAEKKETTAKVARDQAKADYEAGLADITDRYAVRYTLVFLNRNGAVEKWDEDAFNKGVYSKTVFDLAAETHNDLLVSYGLYGLKNNHSLHYVLFFTKDDADRFFALLPDDIIGKDYRMKVLKAVERIGDMVDYSAANITRAYSAALKNNKINKLGFTLPTGEAFKAETWEFNGNLEDLLAMNKPYNNASAEYSNAQYAKERTLNRLFKAEPKEEYVEVDGQRFSSAKDLWNYMLLKNK